MDIRYPVISKDQSREMRVEIRHVFNDVWDPIGVMSDPTCPRDEYDGYIGRMFELLMAHASDPEINDYLISVVDRMGMDASRSSHQDVIAALRKINLDP